MRREDEKYYQVTNWTLVHELIKAALKAREAVREGADQTARNIAIAHLDVVLMHVDEAHAMAEKHADTVKEFDIEKSIADDTNGDGPIPLISINEDDDAPGGVAGIWISMCEYVDLTRDRDDDDE